MPLNIPASSQVQKGKDNPGNDPLRCWLPGLPEATGSISLCICVCTVAGGDGICYYNTPKHFPEEKKEKLISLFSSCKVSKKSETTSIGIQPMSFLRYQSPLYLLISHLLIFFTAQYASLPYLQRTHLSVDSSELKMAPMKGARAINAFLWVSNLHCLV